MKVHVHLTVGDAKIDQVVEGDTADAVVAAVQSEVAKKAGFLVGAVIKRMTPLEFAREATRRYNAAHNTSASLPESCDQFLKMAREKGFATIEGDDVEVES